MKSTQRDKIAPSAKIGHICARYAEVKNGLKTPLMTPNQTTKQHGEPTGEAVHPRTAIPTTPKMANARARIEDCAVRITPSHVRPELDYLKAESAALVRAEVIAKALDVNKRTVCLWAQNGTIPCVRIGGIVRFDIEAIRAVIEERNNS